MVKLDTVRAANSKLVQSQPLVAVFFGGTSGIGHYTLRALATASAKEGKGLRAYIVGRKAQAAEEIIAECRGIYSKGQYAFIKADDLSLIADVDRICTEIVQMEKKEGDQARIDYLMVSHAGIPYLPRKGASRGPTESISNQRIDTKEGIDVSMSLMYYSRMRIINNLMPLLLKSSLPACVVSVFAAGMEGDLRQNDLSIRNLSYYKYALARSHMCYMHTCYMETLAEEHRGKLRLVHIFPGLVPGPGFSNPEIPFWARFLMRWVMFPLLGPFFVVKPDECGQRSLSLASSRYPARAIDASKSQGEVIKGTDGKPGSGAYALNWNGEDLSKHKQYEKVSKDGLRKKIWDHTNRAFEVIGGGNVFAE